MLKHCTGIILLLLLKWTNVGRGQGYSLHCSSRGSSRLDGTSTGYGPSLWPQEKVFVTIPQLKSEKDWLVWKFQVQHALKAADQWQFVMGIADAEQEGYESKKKKAFYSALQCIKQKYMPMVMSSQSPEQIWNALCQFFERKTVSNKVYTLMQLYGLRMKKGTVFQSTCVG